MYPIMNLRYHKEDLHWYFRSLEEVIIRALKSAFSITAARIEGLTGVWVGKCNQPFKHFTKCLVLPFIGIFLMLIKPRDAVVLLMIHPRFLCRGP